MSHKSIESREQSDRTTSKTKTNKQTKQEIMDKVSMFPSAVIAAVIVMSQFVNVQSASAIDLGNCASFAVMGGTAVNFDGITSTVAVGSVGVSPGTSIGGSYIVAEGAVEANTGAAVSCAASMLTAYNAAAGTTCTETAAPTELGGLTLGPGVYCNAAGYFLISAGTLTLTGSSTDIWIFQSATSVDTASSTNIVLTGGALAKNVFWQVGTTLATGASSSFVGTVLAGTSITLGTSATLAGRALAQAAMTCTSGNTVTSFVAGASGAPTKSPTSVAGTASTATTSSSSAKGLSIAEIIAIVVMSVFGAVGVAIAAYFGFAVSAGQAAYAASLGAGVEVVNVMTESAV